MRAMLLAVMALAALGGCALNSTGATSPAIGAAAPSTEAVKIEAPSGRYGLDLSHASVLFRVRHLGMAMYTARFNKFDATIDFNAENPAGSSVTARVDVASVDTGLDNARPGQGAKFDAEVAETLGGKPITFVSTAVERTGPATGKVTGDLTMNGQTRPATFDVTFYGSRTHPFTGKPMLGFAGRATIDRTQWGVTNWTAFTGSEVEIVIEAEFLQS